MFTGCPKKMFTGHCILNGLLNEDVRYVYPSKLVLGQVIDYRHSKAPINRPAD
uniref:Uncharacterized protein n=1 Tax=Arundo donax TaxID=35708 RepID=A0A0A8Z9T3_ARUDO